MLLYCYSFSSQRADPTAALIFGALITSTIITAIITNTILISHLKWLLLHSIHVHQSDHGSHVSVTSLLLELNGLVQMSQKSGQSGKISPEELRKRAACTGNFPQSPVQLRMCMEIKSVLIL